MRRSCERRSCERLGDRTGGPAAPLSDGFAMKDLLVERRGLNSAARRLFPSLGGDCGSRFATRSGFSSGISAHESMISRVSGSTRTTRSFATNAGATHEDDSLAAQ